MKLAITGHRPNKLGNDYTFTTPLLQWLRLRITNILKDRLETNSEVIGITGMALGIDQLYAKILIENNVQFIAAIPCLEQDKMWMESSKMIYKEILSNPLCTIHLVSNTEYFAECMQIRNRWMVDNCDELIAVWDGTNGGTGNCVTYARYREKPILRINPKQFNSSVNTLK